MLLMFIKGKNNMEKIHFKKYKFFVKPCSICNNLQWDSDGCEYSNNTWNYCEYIDNDIMDKLHLWNEFPNIESPKKCTRKKFFKFNSDFDGRLQCDYFDILQNCKDALNIPYDYDIKNEKVKLATRIAFNISEFNFKMRTFGRVNND